MSRIRVRLSAVALALVLGAAAASLTAEVVTLPAAASIQGGNPFFSDVRLFNTSYGAALDVTATYRCFIGNPCPGTAPVLQIHLAPRESKAFDDMVANAAGFNAHDTAGGVEFETSGADGQLVVTSRLYSTSPQNSVGMFIPGLRAPKAFTASALTSIRHDPLNGITAGFRTNAGAFNPGDADASASFTIFNGGAQVTPAIVRTVPAHSGVQISGIFEAGGQAELATENATIVVTANVPIFTYAVVIDNRTADPIFVQGALNQPQGATTPTPTQSGPALTATPTPPGPSPTRTPTVPMGATATRTSTRTPTPSGLTATPTITVPPTITPTQSGPTATVTPTVSSVTSTRTFTITVPPTITRTPTPTPPPGVHTVAVAPGGVHTFQDSTSGTITTTITAGTTVEWQWAASGHSVTSDTNVWTDSGLLNTGAHFDVTFNTPGTFGYHCSQHGGPGSGMHGTVIVNP